MKHYAIDLNNPKLLAIAKASALLGEKLAKITKNAVDANTMAYWSDYYKQYGMLWVRPLALKKSAHKKVANQIVFDVGLKIYVQPWVALEQDAFEHSLKFTLEAVKPSGAIHTSVDNIVVEIENPESEQPRMVGYAHCEVTFPSETVPEEYAATMISQVKKFLDEADFPTSAVEVVAVDKRVASLAEMGELPSIMDAARQDMTLAKMTFLFGLGPSKIAKICAKREKEAILDRASVITRQQARVAQAALEDMPLDWSGVPDQGEGATALVPGGFSVKIRFFPTENPDAFMWSISNPEGMVVKQGQEENQDRAEGQIRMELPKMVSKEEVKKASLKIAMVQALGPVSVIEKFAELGDLIEYRVTTKKGSTAWVSVKNGKVLDKVSL